MQLDRHVVFFVDEFYSLESAGVQNHFARINHPGILFSLFYLHEPMHWVYLLEVLPMDQLCLVPFTSLDLPTTLDLKEIWDALAVLQHSFHFEKTVIYWFSRRPLPQNGMKSDQIDIISAAVP